MSEPASLYARFTLSHEQYEAFMNSAPARPAAFGDWQSWFDRRAIAGEGLADEARLLADRGGATVADVIKAWREDAWTGTPPVEYDELRRTLRIAMLQASENYVEMLHLLTPLRGAAATQRRCTPPLAARSLRLQWHSNARPCSSRPCRARR